MIELQPPNWWEQVPDTSGAIVRLREVQLTDAEALYELLSDPQVSRYISPPPPSAAAFEGFIAWAHQQRREGKCVCLSVVPRGLTQAIGLIQVRALESEFKIAEWGFAIGAAFWSTGIFQEAATLALNLAFGTRGVKRLEARAVNENGRGNRVLEKLGASGEAVLRRAFKREYTQFLWAIVAEEWQPPLPLIRTAFDAVRFRQYVEDVVAESQRKIAASRPRKTEPSFPPFS